MGLADFHKVKFVPGGHNENNTPVGVTLDQGLSNGVPRQMAPVAALLHHHPWQRRGADATDRSAVVAVSHVMPSGIDETTTDMSSTRTFMLATACRRGRSTRRLHRK